MVGLDFSTDQLRLARTRTDGPLMLGDGAVLPFADATFDTAMTMWISTDVDDFGASSARSRACYGRAGSGRFTACTRASTGRTSSTTRTVAAGPPIRPTGLAGWHDQSPWWGEDGIRRRIGMRHVPLAEYLNALISSGLTVEHFEEPAGPDIPHALAFRARKN